jgi:hypothetical protein
MTRQCDIRKYATYINFAIATSLLSAIVSATGTAHHGSHANGNFLNAAHWVLVVLLVAARIQPTRCIQSYAELTWLLYGVLFGEVDMEGPLSSTLVFVSALSFHMYRRQCSHAALTNTAAEVHAVPNMGEAGVSM